MGSRTAILGGRILTPERVIPGGVVVIEDDRVASVRGERGELPSDCQVVDASRHAVTPGLIDLHLHGAKGHRVMGPGLLDVAQELVRHGVTAFLPTALTTEENALQAALGAMADQVAAPSPGARPLGIHLEGPQFAPQKTGMISPDYVRSLTRDRWRRLQAAAKGAIRMVTFAPEQGEGTALLPHLIRDGVVPSIGHSVATFEEVGQMVDLGLRHASHVFNAMQPFHHREPGVVGAVLYHREVVTHVIADLQHVHPAALALLFRLKGSDHVALVSDAAPVAGLPPGEYDWDDETRVIVGEDGTCRLPDGTLAGATVFLDESVANLVRAVGLSWAAALRTATAVPGAALGLRRGRVRPGWIADVVVWDEELRPVATMVEGQFVWSKRGFLPESG